MFLKNRNISSKNKISKDTDYAALIYRWDSNMSDLAERSKVNLDLWNLFIAIVSLGQTYQVRIMTFASTVFKKSTFQKNSHLNALGSKFDLDVK